MIIQRSNNIYEELPKFKVIHGCGINSFRTTANKPIPDYVVPHVSSDIKVVAISNYRHQNPFIELYLNSNTMDFHFIELQTFRCWIDKIEPLITLAKSITNKYILYFDASDALIVSDINNPKDILDKYGCKVLFNAEDGYSQPGHSCDPKIWLADCPDYYNTKHIIIDKNKLNLSKKMITNGFTRSLNAGVFLGEREFLIDALQQILDLMLDNPKKSYPYGESCDQVLWQHIMANCQNNEIEIDFYNLFFLWTHSRKFDFPVTHWEHFNYFNNINSLAEK